MRPKLSLSIPPWLSRPAWLARLRGGAVRGAKASRQRLAVISTEDQFVYALAQAGGALQRCGIEERGGDSPADFARRVRALGLPNTPVSAVLPLAQGQLIQVEAPGVRAEEMKAAARWRIKDQIDGRLEDLTIDVMFVGDDRPRPNQQIFVAAARNTVIRETADRCSGSGLQLAVIELAETAQRNLQHALAAREGLSERATAALVRHGDQCLLTICAHGELHYSRRLPWDGLSLPEAPAARTEALAPAAAELSLESVDFIDYGAEPELGQAAETETPRLVIELQRSFDVWERSWPELPLAALWVQVGEASPALAGLLQTQLGQRVGVLNAARAFAGLEQALPDRRQQETLLPLLGALLRETEGAR